ncbi:hypothetical protein BaOVIS_028370 [Babesia ovis]|uniref:Uncharacterized protein n=1 Tax=Babesia ovis TaxID=5869 RepID=A0A9W5TCU1_BABOV|nr:hypothetical protein BaOVIS_028370 [Babesia ovis]
MSIGDNPKYRRINEDIAAGRFYDSLQHVLSASKRAVIGNKYEEALGVLHHFAEVYIRAKEYAQCLELMNEYISIAKQRNVNLSEENVSQVNSFFKAMTSAMSSINEEPSGPLTKDKIIAGTLAIMESALELIPDKSLYMALGEYYWHEGELSVAQKYLVHTQDIEVISRMLEEWESHVEEHERPFIYLRCILIQLALGDTSGAKCLLLMMNQDFESGESVPLPLQLAYIFTELCDEPDYQLFKVTCKVYKPIIDADPNFPRLVYHLRQKLFPGHNDPSDPYNMDPCAPPGAANPLAALLNSFILPERLDYIQIQKMMDFYRSLSKGEQRLARMLGRFTALMFTVPAGIAIILPAIIRVFTSNRTLSTIITASSATVSVIAIAITFGYVAYYEDQGNGESQARYIMGGKSTKAD